MTEANGCEQLVTWQQPDRKSNSRLMDRKSNAPTIMPQSHPLQCITCSLNKYIVQHVEQKQRQLSYRLKLRQKMTAQMIYDINNELSTLQLLEYYRVMGAHGHRRHFSPGKRHKLISFLCFIQISYQTDCQIRHYPQSASNEQSHRSMAPISAKESHQEENNLSLAMLAGLSSSLWVRNLAHWCNQEARGHAPNSFGRNAYQGETNWQKFLPCYSHRIGFLPVPTQKPYHRLRNLTYGVARGAPIQQTENQIKWKKDTKEANIF